MKKYRIDRECGKYFTSERSSQEEKKEKGEKKVRKCGEDLDENETKEEKVAGFGRTEKKRWSKKRKD